MSAASNQDAPRRRWRASRLVTASVAMHAAAVGAVALRPGLWPWALGGLIADHGLLTAAGLWPRSSLLGANLTRLPPPAAGRREIAVTIDDGPDPDVTPGLLAILEQQQVRATFFCIGERVASNPDLARDIVRRGHAIENHSLRHLYRFPLLGPRAMADEISTAQQIIESTVGEAPQFFRAPAGLRNPFLDPILARLGLQLASWTRRGFDTVNDRPAEVLARLTRQLGPGDILLLHDGHAARTPSGRPVALEVLPALLEAIAAARLTPVVLRGSC
ncbi:MAG TPA: polysaccharide deacetylase family protein [Steroidobacteraceae bacterium]|nr:polysaccharide deacetylase family protein [Steroidobacteraceae bacterium]